MYVRTRGYGGSDARSTGIKVANNKPAHNINKPATTHSYVSDTRLRERKEIIAQLSQDPLECFKTS